MNSIEHLWDQFGKAVHKRIRPASFCVSTFPCVKWDQRINIGHFFGNLSWIIFYQRWIMQFWINIPESYTRSKVSNVIVKLRQTDHYLFKCLSMLKFCNLFWRTLPLFYECAQPCMNAIILILYRHDRELISVYFDMQLVNLC